MKEWDEFLSSLQEELGSKHLVKWIPKLVRFDAANIYLQPEDSFQATWFEEHIRPKLKNLLNSNHRPLKVHLLSDLPPSKKIADQGSSTFSFASSPIDLSMSFENFVVSEENRMVYEQLQDPSYNPLYIYGPKGSGKTHLLMAAAQQMKARGKKVLFVHAETFTDHVVQAIRLSFMQPFRKAYRDIDVLIVDHIDVFSKRAATQEEFFHTFNTLHTVRKQILLSAQNPPSKLTGIEPRLISRFEWGLCLDLKKSPLPEILEKKASIRGVFLSPEIVQWLAKTFPYSAVLALEALLFRAKERPLTLALAHELLQDFILKEQAHQITFEKIIKTVASHYGITPQDILGSSQMRSASLPRQLAMYFCREKLQLPFKKIGELFHRDHSTVLSSIKQIQKEIEKKAIDLLNFRDFQ